MKFTSTEATPAPHVPPGVLRLTGAAKEDIPMYRIQTMNKISPVGLNRFPSELYEVGDAVQDPQGILVRSAKLLDYDFPKNLLAISRAGAGVNNIPLDRCSEAGIVVFNTPGANANAVKELVLGGLVLASRKVGKGMEWAKTLAGQGDAIGKLVEKGKSQFTGPELAGKTLGVVGLGAIGVKVANMATHLGMEVLGYDPYISVEGAWSLSRSVRHCVNLSDLIAQCDYITLHIPATAQTKGSIGYDLLMSMPKGATLVNTARKEVIDEQGVMKALTEREDLKYITDIAAGIQSELNEKFGRRVFATAKKMGAETAEANINAGLAAANQIVDFFKNGNTRFQVNK